MREIHSAGSSHRILWIFRFVSEHSRFWNVVAETPKTRYWVASGYPGIGFVLHGLCDIDVVDKLSAGFYKENNLPVEDKDPRIAGESVLLEGTLSMSNTPCRYTDKYVVTFR
jgi:hypothetical protein